MKLPQTILGFSTSHGINYFSQVNWVKYKYGATVLQSNKIGGAITLGSYIIGNTSIEADPHNSLFQHEYGHYIQSQNMGWGYISRIGIPSIISAAYNKEDYEHDFHAVEQDANARAFLYFNEHVDNFYDKNLSDGRGWNFYQNPLDIDGSNTRDQYVDYKKAMGIFSLRKLNIKAKWYDHTSLILGTFTLTGSINFLFGK